MSEKIEELNKTEFEISDINNNKVMAILAYICFIIPLIGANKSRYASYHTNQGILLFLFALIILIVSAIVPVIGWFIVGPLGTILIIVLMIIGIVNAAKGYAKPLPLFGEITLYKW